MDNNEQRHLSEQLLLLHELQYSNFHKPYQAARTHRNRQLSAAKKDLRPLDTIAVALITGNPEDIFAAAFDKREEPYQAAGTHRNRQFSAANQDLRLLDTIAVALTTGNSGDIFAAAFDKRERIQTCSGKKWASHTRWHCGCRGTHLSHRESCCLKCNAPLSLPDAPVWGQYR